jgi:hypothetical protein
VKGIKICSESNPYGKAEQFNGCEGAGSYFQTVSKTPVFETLKIVDNLSHKQLFREESSRLPASKPTLRKPN